MAGYYKWSPKEFEEAPFWLIKGLSELLDDRQKDLSKWVGYEEIMGYKNLERLFGTENK